MSLFTVPVSVARRLEQISRGFLQNSSGVDNGLCWVKCDDVSCPKQEGGIGMVPLCEMNEASKTKWL